jgi:hypothetical protein
MTRSEYLLSVLRALLSLWQSVVGTIVTLVFLIAGLLSAPSAASKILIVGAVVTGAITMRALLKEVSR